MEIQEAINRIKSFCEEVKDVKENECEAKYDVIAMETVLNELENNRKRINELELHVVEDCSKCPYSPKVKKAIAVASMPTMQKATKDVTNPILEDIAKAITEQFNPVNIAENISKNIMRGGMM